jgi:NAD(P)-dependent dehydrogenase (short-subunit alcohol dehydrogenase family)
MRIFMTGGTSGIGLEAARALLAQDGVDLTIAARRPEAVPSALRGKARIAPVHLESLASVRDLAESLGTEAPFDALLLNAGVQCTSPMTSQDGFELTFAVNHLAHYLLARLLVPSMAQGGRIIFTASGTHDPAEKTSVPPPRHADAAKLADPSQDAQRDANPMTAGRRAYSSSKLCNIMTARELSRRLQPSRPDIAVTAFDPGFTPGTGLARNYPGPTGLLFKYLLPLITRRGPGVSTPAISGRLLADLGTKPAYAEAHGLYFAVRSGVLRQLEPSVLARDPAACAALWSDSARMTGLTSEH